MLPDFFRFLARKNTEFANIKAQDCVTSDPTTKGFYTVLREKILERQKRPPKDHKDEEKSSAPLPESNNETTWQNKHTIDPTIHSKNEIPQKQIDTQKTKEILEDDMEPEEALPSDEDPESEIDEIEIFFHQYA